jgi:peptide/nickel transport system substrate-binding protein
MRSHQLRFIRLITAAAGLSLAAGVVSGCAATPEDEGPNSIRIGVDALFLQGTYDPATAFIFALDTSGVYESLLIRDPKTGRYGPNLAVSYELSDDRRTITFELRDDVTFVGGQPMTAEAVAEYLTLVAADEGAGAYATLTTQNAATFRATGPTTLEVTASSAVDVPGGVLPLLESMPIADPSSMEDREAAATSPKGTGPYLVEEVVPEVSVTLVRNPEYWDPERYPFDEVTVFRFDDDVAKLNALKSGQVDAASIGLNLAEEGVANGLTATQSAIGRLTGLWIADRGGAIVPALADVRVRRAIALAFDREAINDSLNHGYGAVTSQAGVPEVEAYVPGGDDRYGYDPEQARELLAEAGYADGFDITIPITPFAGINEWAPIVQQSLADIGIRVTFEEFGDVGAFFGAALSGEYPVILYREQPIAAIWVFFSPTAVFNHPTYDDAVVADLWKTLTVTGTSEEAVQAQRDIAARALDQAWLAVIANSNNLWLSRPGFTVDVDPASAPQIFQFGRGD